MPKTIRGFTIVELLIVIVVIAILAAITIVAFNSIRSRSENTKTINSIASYAKAITLYATDNGLYPMPSATYRCIGSATLCANLTDGTSGCEGAGAAGGDASLQNLLAPYATSIPSPSSQSMNCAGKNYGGAWYGYILAGKGVNMRAYLKGDINPCPSIGVLNSTGRFQADDTTACSYNLPTLP